MDTGDLERLTDGEHLFISRRREGLSQTAMAEQLGMTRNNYGEIERSENAGFKIKPIRNLKAHEKCVLYRRRCEKTQQDIADELGVSRYWLNRMEVGIEDCTTLVNYWE